MKNLIRAGLLIIGILTLLVACGGGGGGGGSVVTPPVALTIDLTADKSSAVADATDKINLTTTFNQIPTVPTEVKLEIPQSAAATFTDGTKVYNPLVSGSSVNISIISYKVEPVTVTATATSPGISDSIPINFTAPPSNSTQVWTTDSAPSSVTPKLIWATAYPLPTYFLPPNDPKINYTVSANGRVSLTTADNYVNNLDVPITQFGTYPDRSTVNFKCVASGNVTVEARYSTYTAATLTLTCP